MALGAPGSIPWYVTLFTALGVLTIVFLVVIYFDIRKWLKNRKESQK